MTPQLLYDTHAHLDGPRFADDLAWWTDAAKAQREQAPPPF